MIYSSLFSNPRKSAMLTYKIVKLELVTENVEARTAKMFRNKLAKLLSHMWQEISFAKTG